MNALQTGVIIQQITVRALVPRYRLWNLVLAWQCSVCGTLFSLTVDEAQQQRPSEPPPHLRAAFHSHDCLVALKFLAERLQKAQTTRLDAESEEKTAG